MRHPRVLCQVELMEASAICGAQGVVNSARDESGQQILRKVLDGRRGDALQNQLRNTVAGVNLHTRPPRRVSTAASGGSGVAGGSVVAAGNGGSGGSGGQQQ